MDWIEVNSFPDGKKRINGKYVIIKSIQRKKGYQFINDFLEKFVFLFIKSNYKYSSNTGDLAFEYEERQLHSTILPALYELTDACLREQPIKRRYTKDKYVSDGYVDYWAILNGHPLLIEIKHKIKRTSYSGYGEIQLKWQNMVNQLNEIKKNEIKYFKDNKDYVYKLGLSIVPIEDKSWKNGFKSIPTKEDSIIEYGKHVFNNLYPNPDWFCIIRSNSFYSTMSDTYFPAILIYGFENTIKL